MTSKGYKANKMNVDLVKKVREHLALNPWGMSKLMGKNIQSYQNLEQRTQKISILDLHLLYTVSGVTPEVFMRWIGLAAEADKKKKRKKVAKT